MAAARSCWSRPWKPPERVTTAPRPRWKLAASSACASTTSAPSSLAAPLPAAGPGIRAATSSSAPVVAV